MIEIAPKYQKIIGIFLEKGEMKSSDVHTDMAKRGRRVSLVTVKRALSELVDRGVLVSAGSARATSYRLSALGRLGAEVDPKAYLAIEPDKRFGLSRYNFDLLPVIPPDIFTREQLARLEAATAEYERRSADLPPAIQKRELQRLVIELSWKSSKIEGNTYTLFDTEKLILEHRAAPGRSRQETQMILNHKEAFGYIRAHSGQFKLVTRRNLEELHAILVKDLSVGLGFRTKPVGVTGSKYLPLDNVHQVIEAVEALSATIAKLSTPYAKALVALLGISYIQPFEDGNKRTSRLMANAMLVAHGLAPLSYRSIDENEYREAMLVWYELNSIIPMRDVFVGQYEFAARNYAVK